MNIINWIKKLFCKPEPKPYENQIFPKVREDFESDEDFKVFLEWEKKRDDSCTCDKYPSMHMMSKWGYSYCYCDTCIDPDCEERREESAKWEEEDRLRDESCTCNYKDDLHYDDQAGYICCYCDTCIDERCTEERDSRKHKEKMDEERDRQHYLSLRDRFEK